MQNWKLDRLCEKETKEKCDMVSLIRFLFLAIGFRTHHWQSDAPTTAPQCHLL